MLRHTNAYYLCMHTGVAFPHGSFCVANVVLQIMNADDGKAERTDGRADC